MNETRNLICMRVDDADRIVEGSVQTNCEKCDARVWMAPSAKSIIIEEDTHIYCQVCAFENIEEQKAKGDEVEFMPIRKEQIEEIRKEFKRENDRNTDSDRRY